MPVHIQLTANRTGNRVNIVGDGDRSLAPGSGAEVFDFALADPTGLNVSFSSLDTQDNGRCPPVAGLNSGQIVGVAIRPQNASFTDRNSNRDPMDVSYQWNFTCNDPAVRVAPFDPIIKNGGTGV